MTVQRPGRPASARLRVRLCAAVICGMSVVPMALASAGPTILVLGDSISAGYGIQRDEGWVEQLRNRLADCGGGWQVINASISGETTGGGLARLPDALEQHQPQVVIIELGGNDGLRGYPVETIRDNLNRMVELAQAADSRVLLVGMQIPPNYGPRYTSTFAALFEEVAERQDAALVPFILDQVALVPELMQSDGIHPTAEAQDLLLKTVWPHLTPLLEDQGSGQAAAASG